MFPTVLPLRAVLAQILILLLAVATESWFFHKLLNLSPKNSVEYTASINLFSTCAGWLIFFGLEPILSKSQRELLIAFMFLGQLSSVSLTLTLTALILFSLSFFLKFQALVILQFLLKGPNSPSQQPSSVKGARRGAARKFRPGSTQAGVVLIAHTASHSVILLTLFVLRQ